MNAQAQTESLLAAEHKNAQTTLDKQANQWEAALHQVTEMAEEAVEQERTSTVEGEVDTNVFRLELQESQQELQNWDDWYNSGVLPEAETPEQEDFHSIAGEQPASLPAISELLPAASPLAPPVVQHTTLQFRHSPPSNLPFLTLLLELLLRHKKQRKSLKDKLRQEESFSRLSCQLTDAT